MTKRTFCAALLGSTLTASIAHAQVQWQKPPDTYSFVATSRMDIGLGEPPPFTIEVHRNGAKELVDQRFPSYQVRQLYDFEGHRVYSIDQDSNLCSTVEYVSSYVPFVDPIGDPLIKGGENPSDAPREVVNGIKTKWFDLAMDGKKVRFWVEEKYGFMVKQAFVTGSEPGKVVFEMRQLSYAPSPASLFTAPSGCTRLRGVTSATGGHVEGPAETVETKAKASFKGDGKVEAETSVTRHQGEPAAGETRSAPAASAAPESPARAATKVISVSYRLVPESYTGPCPSPVKLVADITTDGPGTVKYEFLAGGVRSRSLRKGTVTFDSAETRTVELEGEYVGSPPVPKGVRPVTVTRVLAAMADDKYFQWGAHADAEYNRTCSNR